MDNQENFRKVLSNIQAWTSENKGEYHFLDKNTIEEEELILKHLNSFKAIKVGRKIKGDFLYPLGGVNFRTNILWKYFFLP
jgi:hypothetical protein